MIDELLNTPVLSRIRRNHGLEHATLQVLARRYPRLRMAGHSVASGFRLVGNLPTIAVEEAVIEALSRLRAGERHLAIHPNCGTNFVTAGTLAGLVAGVSMLGGGSRRRDTFERLSLAVVLATLALIVGMPLGLRLQERFTVSAQPGGLEVVQITRQNMHFRLGNLHIDSVIHFVRTRG